MKSCRPGSAHAAETAEELKAKRLHALRRGRLLTDEELVEEAEEEGEASGAAAVAEEEEEEGEEAGAADDGAEAAAARREVKWGTLPEGLLVSSKPGALNDALKGRLIYMRWPTPHGWLLGTVTERITQATPRLYAKFNYRIKWFDGWENHKLILDNYNSGPSAAYHSWVLLEKVSDVELEE